MGIKEGSKRKSELRKIRMRKRKRGDEEDEKEELEDGINGVRCR